MPTTHFTNEELVEAFEMKRPGKLFRATYVPAGERNSVPLWDIRTFVATNKAEAVKIAREYGQRVIHMDMVFVYLAKKPRW